MNRYCCFFNFGADETQRVTTFILSSLMEYLSADEALIDLANRLFNIYKAECKDAGFREWTSSLSPTEYEEKVRGNHAKLKAEYVPRITREDFSSWLVDLSKCSFSGFDAIGDVGDSYILGWEIRTDLLNLIKNEEGLAFIEFDQSAEYKIALAISDEFFG